MKYVLLLILVTFLGICEERFTPNAVIVVDRAQIEIYLENGGYGFSLLKRGSKVLIKGRHDKPNLFKVEAIINKNIVNGLLFRSDFKFLKNLNEEEKKQLFPSKDTIYSRVKLNAVVTKKDALFLYDYKDQSNGWLRLKKDTLLEVKDKKERDWFSAVTIEKGKKVEGFIQEDHFKFEKEAELSGMGGTLERDSEIYNYVQTSKFGASINIGPSIYSGRLRKYVYEPEKALINTSLSASFFHFLSHGVFIDGGLSFLGTENESNKRIKEATGYDNKEYYALYYSFGYVFQMPFKKIQTLRYNIGVRGFSFKTKRVAERYPGNEYSYGLVQKLHFLKLNDTGRDNLIFKNPGLGVGISHTYLPKLKLGDNPAFGHIYRFYIMFAF